MSDMLLVSDIRMSFEETIRLLDKMHKRLKKAALKEKDPDKRRQMKRLSCAMGSGLHFTRRAYEEHILGTEEA